TLVCLDIIARPPSSPLFPYTTLFRSGVASGGGTFDVLMQTGWVRMRGRRRTPGRPVTYGTTEAFLDHFGLETLSDLPGLEELKRSEEHTSELQSRENLVCRLLLEQKN